MSYICNIFFILLIPLYIQNSFGVPEQTLENIVL